MIRRRSTKWRCDQVSIDGMLMVDKFPTRIINLAPRDSGEIPVTEVHR